jgi:hypothetical protein
MTYKHKLARRLAISRKLMMVPVLLLLAACSDEATAPDTSSPQRSELTALVPAAVTVQTNQKVRFHGRTTGGMEVWSQLTWKSTGGSITTDGVFSAATAGIYKVVGHGRGRNQRPDTSTVVVVPPPTDVVGLEVTPDPAWVEASATRTFTATALQSDGSSVPIGVTWQATGGSIDAGGVYQAGSTAGTYTVIATAVDVHFADTVQVTITPAGTAPTLAQVIVKPSSYSLSTGATKQFRAYGRNTVGDSVAVQATFSATGGTISGSGVYTAGATAGTYRVIASSSGLADTAAVTLSASVPAPAPATLTGVVLKPATYSMTTGTTRQFTAYGYDSLGDSVAVAVTFSATGGTITSSGLYTAGATAGSYRVIASTSALADTAPVTLAPPPTPTTGKIGVPFGASQQLSRTGSISAPFTMSMDAYSPGSVVTRIQAARAGGYTLLLALPGGSHSLYMSTINGVYQFDGNKWRAAMDAYNTSTIRQAVAQGVADGTVLAANIMDEPYVFGGATGGGNTWGPKGTMTKARVDSLCGYVKAIFPSLPAGPEHQHQLFEPDKSYRVCDLYIDQYKAAYGSVTAYRDAGLQMAARDGHQVMFALNILDGGVQDRDGTYDCTGAGQGGTGTYSPNCRMTPEEIRDWGALLGSAGCGGLYLWRYDSEFVANTANQQAFKDLKAKLSTLPVRSCLRN